MVRRTIALTAFPGVLGGSVVAAAWLWSRGFTGPAMVTGVVFVAAMIILLLQRVQACVPAWRHWKPDAGVDVLHMVFSSGATSEVVRAVAMGGLYAASAWLAGLWGARLWPDQLPVWVQLPLAVAIGDLGAYVYHRLSHTWGPLWRLHALHHSSERLYLMSSGRSHPLHVVGTVLVQLTPLVLLGAGPQVLALVGVTTAVHGMLQHANIDLVYGPFNLIFATADYHRWHHSVVLEESHSNYGNTLILWDRLFRTRFQPGGAPEAVGLGVPFPTDFFGQLASPFTWRDPTETEGAP